MILKYSKKDRQLLSSHRGLIQLLGRDELDFDETLKILKYFNERNRLSEKLIQLQNWVVQNNKLVLVIFEGGEFSGKGTAIRVISRYLNPRSFRLVALPKPTKLESQQWYFKRYIRRLPLPGEIVFFDRSWYNRAIVEPVNNFCTNKEYKRFMSQVNHFESMLYNEGIHIVKLYLKISKSEQAQRIEEVRKNPLRRWELTEVDENAQKNWRKYQRYEKAMFEHTNTKSVKWKIIEANDRFASHLDIMKHILDSIPYRNKSRL